MLYYILDKGTATAGEVRMKYETLKAKAKTVAMWTGIIIFALITQGAYYGTVIMQITKLINYIFN